MRSCDIIAQYIIQIGMTAVNLISGITIANKKPNPKLRRPIKSGLNTSILYARTRITIVSHTSVIFNSYSSNILRRIIAAVRLRMQLFI
jgi:hypothetical protein